MDATGDCKPVLGLAIDDRVAAGDGAASLRDLVDRALEDALQLRERRVLGPRRDVKSEQHLAAHRVDIGHRVRGADRAGGVRVVDDRWEEIQRLDDREVARNEIDGRIVGHIETDEQIRGTLLTAHRTQYLRQWAGAQLGPSAGAGGERRQPYLIAREHRWRWYSRPRSTTSRRLAKKD